MLNQQAFFIKYDGIAISISFALSLNLKPSKNNPYDKILTYVFIK